MITIDQRGCGKGKTTQRIYKRIQHNIQHNINTLVVVPGLKLQDQYDSGIQYPIEVINNKIYNKYHYKYKSTVQALMESMKNNENIIIITHKTFTMLPKDISFKNNYDLIIDEALDEVVKLSKINYKKSEWDINLHLEKLFTFENSNAKELIENDDENDYNWTRINVKLDPGQTLLNDSESFTNLVDNNYITYVTSHGWKVLTQELEGEARIINVLDPHLVVGWKDVLVAAAAFKFTKMYYWLNTYGIKSTIITDFEEHKSYIRLHTDNTIGTKNVNQTIVYSNTMIKKYPEIIENYHNYINQHRTGEIITIRNNHQNKTLPNETVLSHNVHGLNDYQKINNVNLESALNMDPHIQSFYKNVWLINLSKYEKEKMILHFHSSYLFYQVIMRTGLRAMDYSNQIIDVFTPDYSIASTLLDYFEPDNIDIKNMNLLENIEIQPKSIGRPIGSSNPNKMTNAERQKKYRNNKKNDN